MSFPMVALSEVLQLSLDVVPVDPSASYPISGVYSFGRGLLVREPLQGTETTYKVFHRLHKDDFVLSQLKGWEGALARVTSSFDGWYLSPQFSTFRAIPDKLDIAYLEWYCKQSKVWEQLRGKARGIGARRDTVSPDKFLSLEIPLPPLSEQRSIVARIEELAAKIEEARGLRRKAGEEMEALLRSEMSQTFDINRSHFQIERLEALTDRIADIDHSMPKAVDNGIKLVSPKDFTPNGIDLRYCKHISKEDFERLRKKIQPQRGDILFSRIGTIGQARLVEFDEEFVASYSIVTIRSNIQRADSKYLLYALQSPAVLNQAQNGVRAIAMPDLGIKTIREFLIPLPPLPEQHRIVAYLDALQAKVDALWRLQAETGAELDALMPAVLDRAFKGEL